MRRILTIGDTHCGNGLGLTPPRYHNDENREWLGALWSWYVEALNEIGPVDVVVYNGDLIDGSGHKDNAYHLTTNIRTQTDMAKEALSLVEAKRRFVVRGTGYHTDGACPYEDYVADSLHCDAYDEVRLDVDGVLFHWRHVVGRSDTPYGQHTQDAKEMTNDMLQGELEDYEHADQLIRSHVHYNTWAGRWNTKRQRKQECWTAPCLQLRAPIQGPYVRKLRTWMYHVGLLLTEVHEDIVHHQPRMCPITLYAPEARRYISV